MEPVENSPVGRPTWIENQENQQNFQIRTDSNLSKSESPFETVKNIHNDHENYPCYLCTELQDFTNQQTSQWPVITDDTPHFKPPIIEIEIEHVDLEKTTENVKIEGNLVENQVENTENDKNLENSSTCKKCKKTYPDEVSLSKHIKKVHENPLKYHCDLCPLRFCSSYYLKRHIQTKHKKMKIVPCQYCGRSFGRKDHMQRHLLLIHEIDFKAQK